MSRAHDKSRLEWETSCTVYLRPASPFVQLLLRFRIAETVTVMHSSLATALSVDCTIWTVHASVSYDRSPPVVLQRCCKAATSGMRRHRHCNIVLSILRTPHIPTMGAVTAFLLRMLRRQKDGVAERPGRKPGAIVAKDPANQTSPHGP